MSIAREYTCGGLGCDDDRGDNDHGDLVLGVIGEEEDTQKKRQIIGKGMEILHFSYTIFFVNNPLFYLRNAVSNMVLGTEEMVELIMQ